MSLSTWLAFFAASWAISFSPGPGAISAMASGLKYGFRRGYWTTAGLLLGLLTQFLIVAVGLGALLAASELAFGIIKWLGVFYRSEERRVGKECFRSCRYRGWPVP